MEQYLIGEYCEEQVTVRLGKYHDRVYAKHVNSYGSLGADNIRSNIVSTFTDSQKQILNNGLNNNMLLVGKVQSGKTSNLEMFTALAFDNGYNLVVIYGGYDSILLAQTTNRFRKTFDIPNETNYSDDYPVIFSTDDSAQLLNIDDEIISDLLDNGKPIFFISMKRPQAMSKVNSLLSRIDKTKLKAFIIDDEGDQASLNTAKNKKEDASATYKQILFMKRYLSDPLYLSVTATPQANIFLNEYSRLRPDSIRLIEPGQGYCGADSYHLFDNNIVEIITVDDHQSLDENRLPNSIRIAINYYIIASAVMLRRGISSSDMIIHSYRTVDQHSLIYNCVENYKEEFKDLIRYNDDCLEQKFNELKECYDRYFDDLDKSEFSFDELIVEIKNVVNRLYIILKNTAGKATQTNESLRKHKIYIGGDLLQRGVTFPYLVTTYFTRWANDGGNMDTNLQRARWFGYRNKYIDLCKIYTTEDISREFTNLSEMETDLWEQFYEVQMGELNINDILIQSENTRQKPTRSNVASFVKVSFKNKWVKQRYGIFDKNQIEHNNYVIEELISNLKYHETDAGRRDKKVITKYAIADKYQLYILIEHIQAVFDLEPFERKTLQDLLSEDNVPLILMPGYDGKGRERSFYPDNKIYALHQGADNKDKSKIIYEGDSSLIVDKNKINIQIHKVLPKKKIGNDVIKLSEYTQYMFAIYLPKEKIYYIKG